MRPDVPQTRGKQVAFSAAACPQKWHGTCYLRGFVRPYAPLFRIAFSVLRRIGTGSLDDTRIYGAR